MIIKILLKIKEFIFLLSKDHPFFIMKVFKIIDNLIFKLSNGKSNFELLLFKFIIFTTKIKGKSDFNIIFIAGCPRSGTTLTRALVGAHPKIACSQREFNIFFDVYNSNILKDAFNIDFNEIFDLKIKKRNIIESVEKVLNFYMEKEKTQIILVKDPFYITMLSEIFYHFPNMKLINVIRDGRDVSCSLRTFPNKKKVNDKIESINRRNPFDWCIKEWVSYTKSGRKWLHSKRYFEVKYEDLVNNTIPTIERIYNFIGLEMIEKENILNFYRFENEEKHLQNIEVGKPVFKKSIGRWKKDMNKSEKKLFKKLAGKLLIQLGYERDNNW
jgi:hypothetical protein